MLTLIIVESPHKAKTVAALARPTVRGGLLTWACLGHLRDLPDDELGIDTAEGFTPLYSVPKRREKTVETLREKINQADQVLIASDPDREGEAIAWHITEVFHDELRGKVVRRVAFHALTAVAVQAALRKPHSLDMGLVQAAVARRVLDRLIGYLISPVLWRALPKEKSLSAGRVQSAALRLLVEHAEQASRAKVSWSVEVTL
jgi:DNA topoisomerase-1